MRQFLNWIGRGSQIAGAAVQPTALHYTLASRPGPWSALRCSGVAHGFGAGANRTQVLRHIDLHIERGQLVLLMGPSGCGKSTLLATLSGLLRPEAGRVVVFAQDLWALSAKEQERFRLRHFGFIFQGYNLFPALNARQQLEIVLRWGQGLGGREARKQADAMLDRLGLGRKGYLRPGQLSGGEKQRVAIGRAMVKNPDICFADEPTNALDWEQGKQVIEMLGDIAHERGATVLAVTHDPRLLPYADRVLYLADGRLSALAPDPRERQYTAACGHNWPTAVVE